MLNVHQLQSGECCSRDPVRGARAGVRPSLIGSHSDRWTTITSVSATHAYCSGTHREVAVGNLCLELCEVGRDFIVAASINGVGHIHRGGDLEQAAAGALLMKQTRLYQEQKQANAIWGLADMLCHQLCVVYL